MNRMQFYEEYSFYTQYAFHFSAVDVLSVQLWMFQVHLSVLSIQTYDCIVIFPMFPINHPWDMFLHFSMLLEVVRRVRRLGVDGELEMRGWSEKLHMLRGNSFEFKNVRFRKSRAVIFGGLQRVSKNGQMYQKRQFILDTESKAEGGEDVLRITFLVEVFNDRNEYLCAGRTPSLE